MAVNTEPLTVDVVIPVHDVNRPLGRAVSSVLGSASDTMGIRVSVVCHNVLSESMRLTVPEQFRDDVRWLEIADGSNNPAAPKNFGLEKSEGQFVTFLDSDDFLEPGAICTWLALARELKAAAVIAPEMHQGGRKIRTPPVRPLRRSNLHPVRDRLSYRTAPLGLFDRGALLRHHIRFAEGFASGEDHNFSLKLWFSGERIAYGRGAPKYVVCDDAGSRITRSVRGLEVELAALRQIIGSPWFFDLSAAERRAIGTKITRVHLFGAVTRRLSEGGWTSADAASAKRFLEALDDAGRGFDRPLSVADRRLTDALRVLDSPTDRIRELAETRRRFYLPSSLISRSLIGQFSVETPLRLMVASLLV